jgi:replicative DNA helicase
VADKLFPEHFSMSQYSKLYSEALASFSKKELFNELIASQRFPELNSELEEIVTIAPVSGDTLSMLADRVIAAHERRELIRKLEKLKEDAISGKDVDTSVLNETSTTRLDIKPKQEIIKSMEERAQNLVRDHGTGIAELDSALNIEPGSLIVVAARPSMGKTVMAISTALHLAKKGEGTLFFSLEMSNEGIMARMLSSIANEPISNILRGQITNYEEYKNARNKILSMPIYLFDESVDEVMLYNMASAFLRKNPTVKNVMIDHLTYIRERGGFQNKHLHISSVTKTLKRLAKEAGVKVWVLSQLSRSIESRANRRPQLSDMRESGSIEEDADVILGIYRESYYKVREEGGKELPSNPVEIGILKNRDGEAGTAHATFIGPIVKFTDTPAGEGYGATVVEYEYDESSGGIEAPVI